MKEKFPDGWAPPRKVSRDAMDGLRQLRALDPETFTTEVLAERFKISPEAVRRILKSKWMPSKERKNELVKREKAAREQAVAAKAMRHREEVLSFTKRETQDSQQARRRRPRDELSMR
jgi:hypothetical protein